MDWCCGSVAEDLAGAGLGDRVLWIWREENMWTSGESGGLRESGQALGDGQADCGRLTVCASLWVSKAIVADWSRPEVRSLP